jgi:hypothetical protein
MEKFMPNHRVLVIPDLHSPGMLSSFPEFLQGIYDKYRCNKVVAIGDIADFHSMSYHEQMPNLRSVDDEVTATQEQLAEVTRRFPKAEYLKGNHCCLIERKAVTAGLSASLVRPINEILNLPRGWKAYPRYHKLIIDDVIYTHGDAAKGGQFAALKTAQAEHMSVVMGHLHSQSGAWYYANERSRIFGCATGCGIDREALQFSYGIKFPTKPIISCAVILDKGRLPIVETMYL